MTDRRKSKLMIALYLSIVLVVPLMNLVSANGNGSLVYSPSDAHRLWVDPYSHERAFISCRWGNIRYGGFYIETDDVIDFFVCDKVNYDLWVDGRNASFVYSVEQVNSHDWYFETSMNATWTIVYMNNGPEQIQVYGTNYCTTQIQIVGVLAGQLFQVVILIGIIGLRMRKWLANRHEAEVKLVESSASSNMWTLSSRLTALSLVGQGIVMDVYSVLEIVKALEMDSPYSGFYAGLSTIIIMMSVIPFVFAGLIWTKKRSRVLLWFWILYSLFIGNMWFDAWRNAPDNETLFLGLSFLIPSWISVAFLVLMEPLPSKDIMKEIGGTR